MLSQPWDKQSISHSQQQTKSLMTVSFTFITSFRRLRLNSPPSVLYLTGIPSWQSWKESICVADNIHSKECRNEKAALFHVVRNWKGFWLVSVIQKFNHRAIVNLLDDRYGLAETARILHYFPQAVFSHRIDGGYSAFSIFPGAGVQRISCRQFHLLSGIHTGFLGSVSAQDVELRGSAEWGPRFCQQKTGSCLFQL